MMAINAEPSLRPFPFANLFTLFGLLLVILILYLAFAGWPPGKLWWQQNAAAILGTLISASGLVLGAAVVVYQLGIQHASSISLLREGKREELRLKIYEELAAKVATYIEASRDARSYATFAASDSTLNLENIAVNLPAYITPRRVSEFVHLHGAAGFATSNLILQIEKWEIAVERIDVFRYALAHTSRRISDLLPELMQAMLPVLPAEIDGRIAVQNYNHLQVQLLTEVVERYEALTWDRDSYVFDLTVEMQNSLLASLFDRRVARRSPPDPASNLVITIDEKDYAGLVRRFKMTR